LVGVWWGGGFGVGCGARLCRGHRDPAFPTVQHSEFDPRPRDRRALSSWFRLRGIRPAERKPSSPVRRPQPWEVLGRYPLSRRLYASVAKLDAPVARVIAFASLFAEPEEAARRSCASPPGPLDGLSETRDPGLLQASHPLPTPIPTPIIAAASEGERHGAAAGGGFPFQGKGSRAPAATVRSKAYARSTEFGAAVLPPQPHSRAVCPGVSLRCWPKPRPVSVIQYRLPTVTRAALTTSSRAVQRDFVPSLPVRMAPPYLGSAVVGEVGLALRVGVRCATDGPTDPVVRLLRRSLSRPAARSPTYSLST